MTEEKALYDYVLYNNKVVEQRLINTQPYEIQTKVGAEVDSKGRVKPSCEIKITRRLESDEELVTLIKADISRGVEECVQAINQVIKKAQGDV